METELSWSYISGGKILFVPCMNNTLHSVFGIAGNQAWWYTPMILQYIQRWMQEDRKFKVILGYRGHDTLAMT